MDPLVRQLGNALQNLAARPESQERFLREFGTWPQLDELALHLDDAPISFLASNPAALSSLEALRAKLDEMSTDPSLWDVSALGLREWEDVRLLALDALSALDALFALRAG